MQKGNLNSRSIIIVVFVVLTAIFFTACSTGFKNISPMPPKNYEKLGLATGKATGSLGILGTAYYFIAMGLNSRIENAYNNAVNSVPGATGLINVEVQESWYWWVIGTARSVTIKGEAIKEVSK